MAYCDDLARIEEREIREKQKLDTIDNMEKMGGSFVKALAECFRRADCNNFEILKEAFQKYWDEYSQD